MYKNEIENIATATLTFLTVPFCDDKVPELKTIKSIKKNDAIDMVYGIIDVLQTSSILENKIQEFEVKNSR